MENSKKEVIRIIDTRRDELIELCRSFERIRTLTPVAHEGPYQQIANLIEQRLKKNGFQTWIRSAAEGKPNVIGLLKGTLGNPTLLLTANTDVGMLEGEWSVDPFGGEVIDGRIYGPGTMSGKVPIAAMLIAISAITEAQIGLRGNLKFAAVVDKLTYGAGIDGPGFLVTEYPDLIMADMVLVGDPTRMREVWVTCKGTVDLRIRVKGVPYLGPWPHMGVNAIKKAMRIVDAFEEEAKRSPLFARKLDIFEVYGFPYPSYNIYMMKGGLEAVSVPESCEVRISVKSLPGDDPKDYITFTEDVVERLKSSDKEIQAEVIAPLRGRVDVRKIVPSTERIVKEVQNAAEEVTGIRPVPAGINGYIINFWFANYLNIPAVSFGPGIEEKMKELTLGPDMYVTIEETVNLAKVYASVILNILS